jgi:hypothetical protein
LQGLVLVHLLGLHLLATLAGVVWEPVENVLKAMQCLAWLSVRLQDFLRNLPLLGG